MAADLALLLSACPSWLGAAKCHDRAGNAGIALVLEIFVPLGGGVVTPADLRSATGTSSPGGPSPRPHSIAGVSIRASRWWAVCPSRSPDSSDDHLHREVSGRRAPASLRTPSTLVPPQGGFGASGTAAPSNTYSGFHRSARLPAAPMGGAAKGPTKIEGERFSSDQIARAGHPADLRRRLWLHSV